MRKQVILNGIEIRLRKPRENKALRFIPVPHDPLAISNAASPLHRR